MIIERGDVWLVKFPLEEDISQTINRPVIILDADKLEVLCTKITKHSPRLDDDYDTPIIYWDHAKLRFESTARISKTIFLDKSMFVHKIGALHKDDFDSIVNKFKEYIIMASALDEVAATTDISDINKINKYVNTLNDNRVFFIMFKYW